MKTEYFLLPITQWRQEAVEVCAEITETLKTIQKDGGGSIFMEFSAKIRDFLQNRLEPHFQAEAKLMEILGRHLAPNEKKLQRILSDRSRLSGLLQNGSLESMLLFVPEFQDHLRFEEDEIFPLMQEKLSDAEKKEAELELVKSYHSSKGGKRDPGSLV